MWLAKGGNDLWHLKPKHILFICECRSMALRVALVSFGSMSPDLDTLTRNWGTISRTSHSPGHPEPAAANLVDDGGSFSIVIRPTAHRTRRCKTFGLGWND